MDAKAIAHSTLAALDAGHYTAPDGATVPIAQLVAECIGNSKSYEPDALDNIRNQALARPPLDVSPIITVSRQTALEACATLAASPEHGRIGVLNFASARNPGGGFLRGARAQEESLARSSALFHSLRQFPAFYESHRAQKTSLYSDRMIYSPDCPVVRDDAGRWLAAPYTVDFITSPAPNAGVILRNEPEHRERIRPTLIERASKVLALAAYHHCETLVLGAWGCGVFANDPATVACAFFDHLSQHGAFYRRFREVHFAVYDSSARQTIIAPFLAELNGRHDLH
jgi:uncharacterized protein (TIGR02452 family)